MATDAASLKFTLTLAAALGCGLMAGALFAFSAFVMRALARLPAPQGVAAMQSINVQAVTVWFMTAFFGTALACLGLMVSTLRATDRPGAGYAIAGCALYLAGTFLVTVFFNVPRNNALAGVDPASADAARLWASYLRSWTAWNHVRTAAAFGAAASLILALSAANG
jgi:uncharacterized membrane protein